MKKNLIYLLAIVLLASCEKSAQEEFENRTVDVRWEVTTDAPGTIVYNIDGLEVEEVIDGTWSKSGTVNITWADKTEIVSAHFDKGPGTTNASLALYVDGSLISEVEWLQGMSEFEIFLWKMIE